jgi:hypothetical protein
MRTGVLATLRCLFAKIGVDECYGNFSTIIGNCEATLRSACCPRYPSSMVKVTSFISLISVITIA